MYSKGVYTTKLTSLITFFKRGPCGLLCCRVATTAESSRVKQRGLAPGTGARSKAPAVVAPKELGGVAPWSREEEPDM